MNTYMASTACLGKVLVVLLVRFACLHVTICRAGIYMCVWCCWCGLIS